MADQSLRLVTDAACVICDSTDRRLADSDLELRTICLPVLGGGE
jgi:hypothetical protein